MTDLTLLAQALVGVYSLQETPMPEEAVIIGAQLARLAAVMDTSSVPPGALFCAEPSSYPAALDALAEDGP